MTTVRREPIQEGITLLTLDRPERLNAMSRELVDDLHEALDAVDEDRAAVVENSPVHWSKAANVSRSVKRDCGACFWRWPCSQSS